jgi:hypothetical protein
MRDIFTVFVFLGVIGALGVSTVLMLQSLFAPTFDGAHFAGCAISTIILGVFFFFVRDEVVY